MAAATPDLQDILATLARFAPPPADGADGYLIAEDAPTPASTGFAPREESMPTFVPEIEKAKDPRLRPQNRSATASPRPMIDPATITTWQDGLRCVTKIAAQNVHFAASIKKMMADQRAHEMRWYRERQALKQTQMNRSSSAANALSILQSLNPGGSATASSEQTEEQMQAELLQHDRKVHAAQQSMEIGMTGELKGLGVPFFGTEQSLVVPDDYAVRNEQLSEGQPKWSPVVGETQLLELRRKMIGHLEDLYRD